MFSSVKWQRIALILNLAGTALLFYSFQATSSNFRLLTRINTSVVAGTMEESALCVYGVSMLTVNKEGGWVVGGATCPDWEHAKSASVVNIEHPSFEGFGFVMLLAGFLLQYLSVPHPKTINQLRADIKAAKKTAEAATH